MPCQGLVGPSGRHIKPFKMLKKNQINRQGEIIINLTVNGVEYDSGLKVPRDADFRWASQEIQKISNILPLNQYIEVQVCSEGFDSITGG